MTKIKRFKIRRFIKYFLLALAGIIILAFLALGNKITASHRYYQSMASGKTQLSQATTAIRQQKYETALTAATTAQQNFSTALAAVNDIKENWIAAHIFPIAGSVDDLEYLAQTGTAASRAFIGAATIMKQLNAETSGRFAGNFSDLSVNDRQKILALAYQSGPELNGLKADLELSLNNLDKIHRLGILLPFNSRLDNIKSQLTTAINTLDQVIPLTQLLPTLAGYPQEQQLLFILQNNDELRPTGGFIGTYGLMSVKDGQPTSIVTEDVYHLDMPCIGQLKLVPPEPIKKYMKVDYWWLRDANFSPDWPTSAKQIETMFIAESQCAGKGKPAPAAVIAINPNLITDLLSLVGPITVNGTTYDSSNFQPLLQYNVEVGYTDKNISSWNRKDIINAIIAELRQRLMALPAKRWPEVAGIFKENAAKRNLQIYFNNSAQEQVANQLGVTGEIKNPASDYLMVVDANLAAYKSDAVVRKNISYDIKDSGQGLAATVTLDYHHEGDFNWRTTRYRSYTRIYAPRGSRLISNGGLDDFSVTDDPVLNKTVFGFFWTIEPGNQKTATISYYLPNNLTKNNYHLYFQKQSGSRLNQLRLTENWNGTPQTIWSGTDDRDKEF